MELEYSEIITFSRIRNGLQSNQKHLTVTKSFLKIEVWTNSNFVALDPLTVKDERKKRVYYLVLSVTASYRACTTCDLPLPVIAMAMQNALG